MDEKDLASPGGDTGKSVPYLTINVGNSDVVRVRWVGATARFSVARMWSSMRTFCPLAPAGYLGFGYQ
jgi:hypothetical protein